MSKFKMSLVVLCVTSAMLACPDSARAQFFEGSGVLGPTPGEPCVAFFPDSGEFPLGLLSDWGDFQLGDHIYAAGVLVACGGFCSTEPTPEYRAKERRAEMLYAPFLPYPLYPGVGSSLQRFC